MTNYKEKICGSESFLQH